MHQSIYWRLESNKSFNFDNTFPLLISFPWALGLKLSYTNSKREERVGGVSSVERCGMIDRVCTDAGKGGDCLVSQ